MEMTKRGVPGVWTYGFYDGWVPNYMFFIAHTHNAIGRFYEVQSFCQGVVRQLSGCSPARTTTSKEWFRPNPPLDSIMWSPRANTNIQESAILFSLSPHGEGQGDVPRQLLDEEQARRRQGEDAAWPRGSFRRTSTRGRTRPKR